MGATPFHGYASVLRRAAGGTRRSALVATPASAKEGLTLTVANNAVFFDRSFSLDGYLQAQGRIHRISQAKDCTITILKAEGTIDDWIESLLAAKSLAAQLAQGGYKPRALPATIRVFIRQHDQRRSRDRD